MHRPLRYRDGHLAGQGVGRTPPAKDKITARLRDHELDLLDYEILSGEEKGKIALYAFALASPAA